MVEQMAEILIPGKIMSEDGVMYLSDPKTYTLFENLYLKVREKEGRIYPDPVVKNSPDFDRDHPLYPEWRIRGKSLNKLEAYLTQRAKQRTILDLGCGNGWLANRLAQIPQCRVFAVDLNRLELEQGARVFLDNAFLHFVYGDIFENAFQPESFDLILLASSIQYFSDIPRLINRLLDLLRAHGEIHIIDSPFYTQKSAVAARQRSLDYYQELGFPEMADRYYHHLWTEFAGFHHRINYDPDSHFHRFQRGILKRSISPFPWIVIQP